MGARERGPAAVALLYVHLHVAFLAIGSVVCLRSCQHDVCGMDVSAVISSPLLRSHPLCGQLILIPPAVGLPFFVCYHNMSDLSHVCLRCIVSSRPPWVLLAPPLSAGVCANRAGAILGLGASWAACRPRGRMMCRNGCWMWCTTPA